MKIWWKYLPSPNSFLITSGSYFTRVSLSIFIKLDLIHRRTCVSVCFFPYFHVSDNYSEKIQLDLCLLPVFSIWKKQKEQRQILHTYPRLFMSPFFWASVTASCCLSCLSSSDSAWLLLGRVEAAADAAATSSGFSVSLKKKHSAERLESGDEERQRLQISSQD